MRIGFFATEIDELEVWRTLFAIPGMRVLESHSHPDKELREFVSIDDLQAARATDNYLSLAAWPSNVGGSPTVEFIVFEKRYAAQSGHKGRQCLNSPAFIGFTRFGPQSDCLTECTFTAWNEAGARERSIYPDDFLDDVDWKQFASIFRRIQREIGKAAPAKLGSAPILPDAFFKLSSGELKLWGWGEEVSISSPHLVIKAAKLR